MSGFAYVDGKILPSNQARIPFLNRASWFGDGVFETMLVIEGAIVDWSVHSARIERAMATLALDAPADFLKVEALTRKLCERIKAKTHYLRLMIVRDDDVRTIAAGRRSLLWLHAEAFSPPLSVPKVSACTLPSLSRAIPEIKSLSYLASLFARQEAKRRGVDVGIFCDQGMLLEADCASLLALQGDMLITPSADVLESTSVKTLARAVADMGIALHYQPIRIDSVVDALMTISRLRGVSLVTHLDGEKRSGTLGRVTPLADAFWRESGLI